jgi:hypothetical protein
MTRMALIQAPIWASIRNIGYLRNRRRKRKRLVESRAKKTLNNVLTKRNRVSLRTRLIHRPRERGCRITLYLENQGKRSCGITNLTLYEPDAVLVRPAAA